MKERKRLLQKFKKLKNGKFVYVRSINQKRTIIRVHNIHSSSMDFERYSLDQIDKTWDKKSTSQRVSDLLKIFKPAEFYDFYKNSRNPAHFLKHSKVHATLVDLLFVQPSIAKLQKN